MLPTKEASLSPIRCELCQGRMKLVRRVSEIGALPKMAVYQCQRCQHTVTRPVEDEE